LICLNILLDNFYVNGGEHWEPAIDIDIIITGLKWFICTPSSTNEFHLPEGTPLKIVSMSDIECSKGKVREKVSMMVERIRDVNIS
jgi:ubiquitin-protein ligase